jgi:uncharacterized protein YdeI (YjbR/CyaY-like superfamily)
MPELPAAARYFPIPEAFREWLKSNAASAGETFAHRTENKSRTYSYEQPATADLTPGELKAFKKNKAARAFFERQAPSYKKKLLWRIVGAKQQKTRDRRLTMLIESSANELRL